MEMPDCFSADLVDGPFLIMRDDLRSCYARKDCHGLWARRVVP